MTPPNRAAAGRRRIVMLVQNNVTGDSRVQKQAASTAAAGWDVTLLGRMPGGKPETSWELGGAMVRLVPVKLGQHRHEARPGRLRAPLSYAPGPRRRQRTRMVRAWHADIGERKARLAVEGGGVGRRAALLSRRVAVKLAASWIRLRVKQTDRLRQSRKDMDSWIDQVSDRYWELTMGDRVWQRFDPRLWEYEIAFGKVIDEIEPDLIHANDFQMLGVGARAVMRLRAKGRDAKLVWDAHEFLPGMKPWVNHPRWHRAQMAAERAYAADADAVTTVSEPIAHLLRERHSLRETPTVVMNTPDLAAPEGADAETPSLRAVCGLDADTPLMVYSGAISIQRGLADMVEALPGLPGVHCALVVLKPEGDFANELRARAEELGVADRLHVLPYVEYWQVVPFLSSADVGVIPIHHYQNHELALITKFFEYSHARLPIVVSDVETMGGMVAETGQGEVFRAADVGDLVRAVKAVLDEPDRYRKVYETGLLEDWTWASQVGKLHEVYRRLLADG